MDHQPRFISAELEDKLEVLCAALHRIASAFRGQEEVDGSLGVTVTTQTAG